MAGRDELEGASVFLSYSRDDAAFADELADGLRLLGIDVFVDQDHIEGAELWRKRLKELIDAADTVVFILSPTSAASPECAWEVDQAVAARKRIAPVLLSDLGATPAPEALAALNYVRFDPEDDGRPRSFVGGLRRLATILRADLGWIREHARLYARAQEWEAAGRIESRMLLGADIAAAKAWAARRPSDAPEPTDLHMRFIAASEASEAERTSQERARLAEMRQAQSERAAALEAHEATLRKVSRRNAFFFAGASGLTAAAGGLAYWGYDAESRFRRQQEETARAAQQAREEDIRRAALRRDVTGRLVIFPAPPGQLVPEGAGDGDRSPFSATLLRRAQERDLDIEDAVRRTRTEIERSGIGPRPLVTTDMNAQVFLNRHPEERSLLALVIANSDYATFETLPSARRDGEAWAAFLEGAGFDVTFETNLVGSEILSAIDGLSRKIDDLPTRPIEEAARDGGGGFTLVPERRSAVVFVYFAGHGVIINKVQAILPVDRAPSDAIGVANTPLDIVTMQERLTRDDVASIFVFDVGFNDLGRF